MDSKWRLLCESVQYLYLYVCTLDCMYDLMCAQVYDRCTHTMYVYDVCMHRLKVIVCIDVFL